MEIRTLHVCNWKRLTVLKLKYLKLQSLRYLCSCFINYYFFNNIVTDYSIPNTYLAIILMLLLLPILDWLTFCKYNARGTIIKQWFLYNFLHSIFYDKTLSTRLERLSNPTWFSWYCLKKKIISQTSHHTDRYIVLIIYQRWYHGDHRLLHSTVCSFLLMFW